MAKNCPPGYKKPMGKTIKVPPLRKTAGRPPKKGK